MTATGFIEDGYSLEKTIPGVEGFYPDVTVTYRPMTEREISRHRVKLNKLPETEAGANESDDLICTAIANHIIDWDVKNGAGQVVEIDKANCGRIERHLQGELYKLICGLNWEAAAKN